MKVFFDVSHCQNLMENFVQFVFGKEMLDSVNGAF